MSEDEKTHTSILLPGARVALFSTDHETREAFAALETDWRYARVRMEAHEGDVELAIRHYTETAAPDLVIVQTETIDGAFTERLEALASHLSENTAAIVIGPVNDVNLYRRLVNMGVSDYLVKPIQPGPLGEDIASALLEQIGTADSRMIALLGAKGGTGVTTLTEALAWSIAGDLEQKTFLLDAAGGWSTLSVGMGFDPSTTLHEVVRAAAEGNEDSLTRMIHKADEKLFILSSGGDVMLDDPVEPEQYEIFLDYLAGLYPVVLIDLSSSTSGLKRAVLARAHLTMLVTTGMLPSVRAARTLLQEIKQIRGGSIEDVEVILNMQGYSSKFEVPKAQIVQGLERPPSVVIPFDPDLFVSVESEAAKLGAHKNGGSVINELLAPVRQVLSLSPAAKTEGDGKGGGLGKLLGKLKTK